MKKIKNIHKPTVPSQTLENILQQQDQQLINQGKQIKQLEDSLIEIKRTFGVMRIGLEHALDYIAKTNPTFFIELDNKMGTNFKLRTQLAITEYNFSKMEE